MSFNEKIEDLQTDVASTVGNIEEKVQEKAESFGSGFKARAEEFKERFSNGECPEPPKDENGNPIAPPEGFGFHGPRGHRPQNEENIPEDNSIGETKFKDA